MRVQLMMTQPELLAASTESRTISGQVVPYGVPGRTSIGELAVARGALAWPPDLRRIKLLREHDRSQPVGHATAVADTVNGLGMTFRAARTPAGDLALLEASEGVRDALSVELDDVTVSDGTITAGQVVAVAQVALPAYDDARVTRVAASQPAPDEPEPEPEPEPAPQPAPDPAPEPDPGKDDDMPDDTVTAALVPIEHQTGRRAPTLSTVERAVAAKFRGDALTPELAAALTDITHTANSWVQSSQFLNELWSGVPYARRVVPLVNNAALTSYKVVGWRWSDPPTVATYAGDKADVPSDAAVTVSAEATVKRLAGAHDVDRKFWDFGDQAFISAYFQAMAASYAMKSDQALAADLLAAAPASTPTGGDLWGAIIVGAMNVYAATGADATFALANPADIITAAATTAQNAPAFLPAVLSVAGTGSVGGLTIVPVSSVTAGTVVVGARMAATFYELAGSPLRVEAVSLPDGGVNVGVFGYYATLVHATGGLSKVSIVTVP